MGSFETNKIFFLKCDLLIHIWFNVFIMNDRLIINDSGSGDKQISKIPGSSSILSELGVQIKRNFHKKCVGRK